MGMISFLWKLIFIPDTLSKSISIHFKFLREETSQEENNNVSSVYYRARIPPGLKSSNVPLTKPVPDALASILVKASTSKLNRRGDMGSSCLKPFPVLKVALSSPLANTLIEPPKTILLIQPIHLSPKPLAYSISTKNRV
jgi:hypothetical protein